MGTSGFGINLNTTGMNLGTGINVQSTVAAIIQADSVPLTLMQNQQTAFGNETSAINNINSLLSTLQTSVWALQDPLGQLTARSATSSNSSVLTASAAADASLANHVITVSNLASTSSTYSTNTGLTADSTIASAPGTFTIQVGGSGGPTTTVNVDSTTTLNSLAAAINSSTNPVVTATVITDLNGTRLALVSNTSGSTGNVAVTANGTSLSFNPPTSADNAQLTVDGVPVTSASNTITGVIPGVTLNLVGTSASQVTLNVTPDTTQAAAAVNSFVSAYNAVVQAINTQSTYASNGSSQPPLFADNSLADVQQKLASDINFAASGSGITSLASLGINLQQDGTLSVNSATLNSALTNNFSGVQAFLQQAGSNKGFAGNLANDLQTMTDPTQGALYLDLQGISQSSSALAQQIADFQVNLNQQQALLTQQFSAVNTTLQMLPLMLSQITGQLKGGSSSSSGG